MRNSPPPSPVMYQKKQSRIGLTKLYFKTLLQIPQQAYRVTSLSLGLKRNSVRSNTLSLKIHFQLLGNCAKIFKTMNEMFFINFSFFSFSFSISQFTLSYAYKLNKIIFLTNIFKTLTEQFKSMAEIIMQMLTNIKIFRLNNLIFVLLRLKVEHGYLSLK